MFWEGLIAFIVGIILPMVFLHFFPNEKFFKLGLKVGRKISSAGSGYAGKDAWELFEDTLIGSAVAFVNGIEQGANEDDEEEPDIIPKKKGRK